MALLNEIKIISHEKLTIPAVKQIKRTWRQRFFSVPWKPWVKTRPHHYQAPDPCLWLGPDNHLYGHPETIKKLFTEKLFTDFNLQRAIENREKARQNSFINY